MKLIASIGFRPRAMMFTFVFALIKILHSTRQKIGHFGDVL